MKKTKNTSKITYLAKTSILLLLLCCFSLLTKAQSDCYVNYTYSSPCTGSGMTFQATCIVAGGVYTWDFGDGTAATGSSVAHQFSNPGTYNVSLRVDLTNGGGNVGIITTPITVLDCPETGCVNCIGSFAPTPGDYMISVWVKEDKHLTPVTNYDNTGVQVSFVGNSAVYGPFYPDSKTDPIIDGWQRIEQKITVPASATDIIIDLRNDNSPSALIDSYFDDIRIHPFDASMKSYVYDPITLRLVAELDENNYATIYEYDEEGKLIRVKKETERGIMTIKETRSANSKK